MKVEGFHLDSTPQSSFLSMLHCEIEIIFLEALSRCIIFFSLIKFLIPSLSMTVKVTIHIPLALVLPSIPYTSTASMGKYVESPNKLKS